MNTDSHDTYYVFDTNGKGPLELTLNKAAEQGWEVVQVLYVEGTCRTIFRDPASAVDPTKDSHSAFDDKVSSKNEEVTVTGLGQNEKMDVITSYRLRGWEILSMETPPHERGATKYNITFRKF
jgi:hypothetical protein